MADSCRALDAWGSCEFVVSGIDEPLRLGNPATGDAVVDRDSCDVWVDVGNSLRVAASWIRQQDFTNSGGDGIDVWDDGVVKLGSNED